MKNYIINAVVALLLIVGVGVVTPRSQSDVNLSGLSERDIQAVSLKVGSPTQKFTVNASGTKVSVGTTTPITAGEVVIDSTATSTLAIASSDSAKGGCIQIEATNGAVYQITVSAAGSLTTKAGACE